MNANLSVEAGKIGPSGRYHSGFRETDSRVVHTLALRTMVVAVLEGLER